MSTPGDEQQGVEPEPQAAAGSPEATKDRFQAAHRGAAKALALSGILALVGLLTFALVGLLYVTQQKEPWDDHAKTACLSAESVREHSEPRCTWGVGCSPPPWSEARLYEEMTEAVAEAKLSSLPDLAKAADDTSVRAAFRAVNDWCE